MLGVADGILNALTLASASFLSRDGAITVGLAFRVAIAAFATAAFVFFVAQYADYRGQLVTAARHLSLHSSRRLTHTALGSAIARDALVATLITGCASFPGALVPLLIAAFLPAASWVAVPVAVSMLGALGAIVAGVIDGSRVRWALVLSLGGVLMTAVGYQLQIA